MSHPGLTLGGLSLLAAKWLAELRAAWPSHAEALKLALQRFFHQWRQDVQKLTARQWASLAVLALLAFRGGLLQKFLDLLRWSPVRKNFLKDAPAGRGGAHFGDYRQALPKWLADGLQEHSFTEMKPIQRKVLPLALAGHDVVATAPTGSGKTLAFLVPAMVHATNQSSPRSVSEGPIALILAPTRELVMQIKTVAEKLTARARRSCTVAAVYGGQRRMDQLQILKRQGVIHLLVGTVGRLLDFMHPRPGDQKAFKLTRCSFLVLDEGDKMLDDGFEEEVALIGAEARRDKQVLFFSATWPPSVERSARALCRAAPRRVALEPEEFEDRGDQSRALPPSAIRQIVEVPENGEHDSKLPILLRYLEDSKLATPMQQGGGKVLIFVRTITAAEDLATLLQQKFGSKCDAMHGKRKQEQREQSLNQFRMGHTRALIATDVLGRGVDIPDVTMVFIYDFPDDIETYIHRVGRTGRNGRQGKAVSLFHRQYWNAYLAKELQDVLQRCEQEVPVALEEAASAESSWQDWNSSRQWWR